MKEKLFIATFSQNAIEIIKKYGLGMEINHTCISEALDIGNRNALLEDITCDLRTARANRIMIHGPFTEIFPAGIDKRARDFAMSRLNEAYDVAAAVGARNMVVHTGYVPFIYFKSWQAEKSAIFWQKFMEDKPYNFRIYIENVLEDEPEMLLDMMQQISDERIRLCLDIGHANAASLPEFPVNRWIEVLGPYIGHFHLHNNYGDCDSHGSLGDGSLNMKEILKAADRCCPWDTTFTIESRDCAASVEWLKKENLI